ncbi:ECF-type sigma factor [Dokdonella fugitiva]|uniref:ECF-type sigma factor n=1 Tax=Dokdonella fugitiva TaxID=328517 RepID=UPI0015FB6F36|nr:ECF-type sigma factor [Dokdonella fugitiva]MBA8882394.1 RNA polymerase sigma factor (TIGR02999 family) [Dokdonella fugitiva]
MEAGDAEAIDRLLAGWTGKAGAAALDAAMPLVYLELKSIATRALRSHAPGAALQTTALVHETYLKLRERDAVWNVGRHALVAMAAQAMRRILVDDARRRDALKRQPPLAFDGIADAGTIPDVLELDALLDELATLSARQAQVVELKCFAGMSIDDIAGHLGVARVTVVRDWRIARAWLAPRMAGE